PDLRFGLEIADVTHLAKQSTFKVFLEAAERGHVVRALNAKGAGKTISNTELKPGGKVPEYAAQYGAKGLAWFKVEGDKLVSSIEKFFAKPLQEEMRAAVKGEDGDLLIFVADSADVASQVLGAMRGYLANRFNLISPTNRDF